MDSNKTIYFCRKCTQRKYSSRAGRINHETKCQGTTIQLPRPRTRYKCRKCNSRTYASRSGRDYHERGCFATNLDSHEVLVPRTPNADTLLPSSSTLHTLEIPPTLLYPNYEKDNKGHEYFQRHFIDVQFGYSCDVCDRLWYSCDLKPPPENSLAILGFSATRVCSSCYISLQKGKLPTLATSNGFYYPNRPADLPILNAISERLISPRLPFLQIRRLLYGQDQFGVVGQIINVPVEVQSIVNELPRSLSDDYCININIKKRLVHESSFYSGLVQKQNIKQWLAFLINQPLYKMYNITASLDFLSASNEPLYNLILPEDALETIEDEDSITAYQQTLLWNKDKYLKITPEQSTVPFSIMFDEHSEELSFPSIYLGQPRVFKENVRVTPFMIATSEIRRSDRRGVTPNHLLYMAMKILQLRVKESLTMTFKLISNETKITKEQILSEEYLNNCMEKNLVFLKAIPNSIFYWESREKDLFAMIQQIGKPTVFLTLNANELGSNQLLRILYQLATKDSVSESFVASKLSRVQKLSLINEDPVTCSIYFHRLVNCILNILMLKKNGPFGKYYVVEYFLRIKFQNGGSPYAQILLWLQNAPQDIFGADNKQAIELIDTLISVATSHASSHINLQTHKHTFTCFKQRPTNQTFDSSKCRFDVPFLPMRSTTIITPMNLDDLQKNTFKQLYKKWKLSLIEKNYANIDEFFLDNQIYNENFYIDVISATIIRPQVFLKRKPSEAFHNSFNPFILNKINSSMDIQFITDEYSCAQYIIECINKSSRGISDLQRRILELQDSNPEFGFTNIAKNISIDLLNSIEMSVQEAAWFLLRFPMSHTSAKIEYINTVWPSERNYVHKPTRILKDEALSDDSSDIWLENWIEKYEKRPDNLSHVTLAQFVCNYIFSPNLNICKLRQKPHVLRYRNYCPKQQTADHVREMVLLHFPFRNEEMDILTDHKYINIFNDNLTIITKNRKLVESSLDMDKIMELYHKLCAEYDEEDTIENPFQCSTNKEILENNFKTDHVSLNDNSTIVTENIKLEESSVDMDKTMVLYYKLCAEYEEKDTIDNEFQCSTNEEILENDFKNDHVSFNDNLTIITENEKLVECSLNMDKTMELYHKFCAEHDEEDTIEDPFQCSTSLNMDKTMELYHELCAEHDEEDTIEDPFQCSANEEILENNFKNDTVSFIDKDKSVNSCQTMQLGLNVDVDSGTQLNSLHVSSFIEEKNSSTQIITVPRLRWISHRKPNLQFSNYIAYIKHIMESNPDLLQDYKFINKITSYKLWRELYEFMNRKLVESKQVEHGNIRFGNALMLHGNHRNKHTNHKKKIQNFLSALDKWFRSHSVQLERRFHRNNLNSLKLDVNLKKNSISLWKSTSEIKEDRSNIEKNQACKLNCESIFSGTNENLDVGGLSLRGSSEVTDNPIIEHAYCMNSQTHSSIDLYVEKCSAYPCDPISVELPTQTDDTNLENDCTETIEVEFCDLSVELESLSIKSSEITVPPSETINVKNEEFILSCVINELPESFSSNPKFKLHFETYEQDEISFHLQYNAINHSTLNQSNIPEIIPNVDRCRCSNCEDNLLRLMRNGTTLNKLIKSIIDEEDQVTKLNPIDLKEVLLVYKVKNKNKRNIEFNELPHKKRKCIL